MNGWTVLGMVAVLFGGVGSVWFMARLKRSRDRVPVHDGAVHTSPAAAGPVASPRAYSPQNVGNDASARPWERNTTSFDLTRQPQPGQAGTPAATQGVSGGASGMALPAGFDVEAFLQVSKGNFIGLQAAWDRSDIASLKTMMTDEMLRQVTEQLTEREQGGGRSVSPTEVVMLEAHLLDIEQASDALLVSVEFSGMVREDPSAGPNPFREVWAIRRPLAGSADWQVSSVQALQ